MREPSKDLLLSDSIFSISPHLEVQERPRGPNPEVAMPSTGQAGNITFKQVLKDKEMLDKWLLGGNKTTTLILFL